ncbi:unnamed protein product [Candidula unifasciata]|uniref:NADP-dependent oxidoreductase domain-containing protein n=1 Tax=Candidula unifasciata TaxID=100452 RepID=A0A8S3YYE4_9EUPU|nr:unnamed protein product [Candidula unifasciata]
MTTPIPEEHKVAYNFLGRSGIKVSNISLGCATFGDVTWGWPGQTNEEASHQIINRYVEWGGNFLDTADIYALGKSESIVGTWLERQPRDKFVIATKVRQNMGTDQNVNNVGLSRRHITASIDNSLKRLRTDYVDLYQIHAWDDGTPIEETLRALDDLVRVGKVRYVGLSNVTGWQLQKIVDTSERYGLNSIVSLQQQYSLASRDSELEVFQVSKSAGIAVLPWSPLKGGLLTGKVKRGVKPTEGRLGSVAANTAIPMQAAPHWSTFNDQTFDIIETVEAIAKKRGRSIPQVALRWLLQKDIVPSVIIGAKTLAQLDDNMLAANGWSLTKEEMKQLDDVSRPALPYPYDMVFSLNADRVNPRANNFYVSSVAD